MKKSTTILLAAVLLLGAGTLVWWKKGSVDVPSTSTEQATSVNYKSRITNHKSQSSRYTSLTNHALPTHTRLDLARSIDTGLKPAAIAHLLTTFTHAPPHQSREQWWLVLNEIMEQMRKKGVAPDLFGSALTALVSDPAQSEVVRDYAIQHLSQWIAPSTSDTPGEPSPQVTAAALQAIAATITDPSIAHTSIPGTALMSLTAVPLPELTTTLIWLKLDPVLTTILKGETHGSLSTRTTIIQSVALRNSRTHLPLIQTFARDEKADPSLRLSSIAALGIYHSEGDRDYLTSIAIGSTRYRHAAQSALKKFSN